MKNKIRYCKMILVMIAMLLCMSPSSPVFAEGDLVRIVDWANLLSDSEEAELSDKLDEISERQQLDVVVVTVESLEGASAMEYAGDFYDSNGYGLGDGRYGILLLLSMEDRDWYMLARGYRETAFTDDRLNYMSEQFIPYISDGEYAVGFTVFADLCDEYVTQANAGEEYDSDSLSDEGFSVTGSLMVALGVGFVISLIVTGFMRMGMKSVRSQARADSYVRADGLRLTRERDMFLYKRVDRREKPRESESSSSSSGASSGGVGGKF